MDVGLGRRIHALEAIQVGKRRELSSDPLLDVESSVTLEETTHTLYFVEDVDHIDTGPKTSEVVQAWKMTNSRGMSVTMMRQGACIVDISKNGQPYLCVSQESVVIVLNIGAQVEQRRRGDVLRCGR